LTTGAQSLNIQEGAVKISGIDPVTFVEIPISVLLSPNPVNYGRFGHAIAANTASGKVFVGAPSILPTTLSIDNITSDNIIDTVETSTDSISVTGSVSGIFTPGDVITLAFQSTIVNDPITYTGNVDLSGNFNISVPTNVMTSDYDTRIEATLFVTGSEGTTSTIIKAAKDYSVDGETVNAYTIPGQGKVYVYNTNLTSSTVLTSYAGELTYDISAVEFGYSISTADSGLTAVGAPGGTGPGVVVIYSSTTVWQTLAPADVSVAGFSEESLDYGRFGDTVLMAADGNTLFVTSPNHKNQNQSYGAVVIYYKQADGKFGNPQVLTNPISGIGMQFGKSINYDAETETLVISSVGTNNTVYLTIDRDTTIFDAGSTTFLDSIKGFGTVYVYNKVSNGTRYVLAEELQPALDEYKVNPNTPNEFTVNNRDGARFGSSIALDRGTIYVGAPGSAWFNQFHKFEKIDLTKNSLDILQQYEDLVDIDVIDKVSLLNVYDDTIIEYLDVIDPIKGKIASIADQEIKFKSAYDPAIYSVGNDLTINDQTANWVDDRIGEVWWDLSTVKYTWYEQGSLLYRKNNWGKLFPGSSIDIYEWVGSDYLPSEWAALADTEPGLTESISGQPMYPDDSVLSIKQIYNSASNSFSNRYYFWVKNKVTVPNSKNRRISAFQISNIIQDPTAYGLKYLAVLGQNSFAVANSADVLVDNRVHLNIGYDNIKNTIPRHTEWLLLQEGAANSRPNTLLEKKLLDSLLGHDSLGNPVPDPALSDRMKYGINIRPRQTLFKDRKSALRNLIEFSNSILQSNRITGDYSFANLEKQELAPDSFSQLYDEEVEDNEGLLLISTSKLKQAVLSCSVNNGKITSVTIDDPGFGYKVSPNVEISGDTSGASIKTKIDEYGRVSACVIENAGYGYPTAPRLGVRSYAVLVSADNVYNGKWTLFSWDSNSSRWLRARTQQYNTPAYWKYIDWVSSEYNQFIDYADTVNEVYQLNLLTEVTEGQYVKVKDGGDGRYLILRKTDGTGGTFDSDYDLMYSERGTIQILDTIWNTVGNDLNFDDVDSRFDQTLYDQTPDTELQNILVALRDDLFVNELKVNWNLMFFKMVRYALTEQKLLDWAFKTSFINVTNYAGLLDQRPVYKVQDSQYYEDYLKEVKPYHTQVRSYTTNYGVLEPTQTYTTDFDLPSTYNPTTGKFEVVETLLSEYPWKAWDENHLYTVGSISIGNPGAGYAYPPEVVITAASGDSGSGATAQAYISSGKVSSIVMTNPGSNYSKSPVITLIGGSPTTAAIAYARLFNGKVRTNAIEIKFDRISRSSSIGNTTAVDKFICNGSSNEFVLTWLADPNKNNIEIILDGELIPPSDYKIENYKEFYNGYNKSFSKIVFIADVPSNGATLAITYSKHVDLFTAIDRATNFYNPTSGMPGTLAQIIDGIDYPKTRIEGLPFDYTTSWDLEYSDGNYSKFGESAWADEMGFYKKTVTISTTTYAHRNYFTVDDVTGLAVGMLVNVISTSTTTNILGTEPTVTITAITENIVSVSTLIDESFLPIPPGLEVEFWTYDSNFSALDSNIIGGGLTNTNVLGINPSDIIIDGDAFISPNVSYAPDELVPGHAFDSIGINVYTRHVGITAPTVISNSFNIAARTTSTNRLSLLPSNKDSIAVTFDRKLFEYSTTTAFTTVTNSTKYSINWETGDLIVGPQSVSGKLGYTVISIGSSSPINEIGVIDNQNTVSTGTSTAKVESLSSTSTVKSAYVTVNGISIPESATSTSTRYVLSYSTSTSSPRAEVSVYNLSTSTTNSIQAWFFGNENKYFNEVTEQFITYTATTASYVLSFPPGEIEPAVGQTIVEVITSSTARRLLPPLISYYEVTDPNRSVYPINNHYDVSNQPQNRDTGIRIYINGQETIRNVDWSKELELDEVKIRRGILRTSDVIAIVVPSGVDPIPDFDVQSTVLTIQQGHTTPIPSGATLRVITYNNHDNMLMRTERFKGSANRRFKISRPILNDNYVWVDLNGISLINRVDFDIMNDQQTIQISDKFIMTPADNIVITSLGSEKLSADILGYRIFNDMFNRTHFERLSKKNSTTLTKELLADDIEIHVKNAAVLTQPIISKKMPGVVIIAGERIEFFRVVGNILTQLRRSSLGTGPKAVASIGTKVIDQGLDQTVPFDEQILKQICWTTTATNVYGINTVTQTVVIPGTTATVMSDGITLRVTPVNGAAVEAKDQITVYYGGRQLRKDGIVYHDTNIAYDNVAYDLIGTTSTVTLLPLTTEIGTAFIVSDTNQIWVYSSSLEEAAVNGYVYKGLNYLDPEFTVNTATHSLVLNLPEGISQDVRLEIVKKEFDVTTVWNDTVTTSTTISLMNSASIPAKFIRARPAELPDKHYYGR
jgi:hypothetical protein